MDCGKFSAQPQQAYSPPSTTGHMPHLSANKPIHCQATRCSPRRSTAQSITRSGKKILRLTCPAATIHVALNYTTILDKEKNKNMSACLSQQFTHICVDKKKKYSRIWVVWTRNGMILNWDISAFTFWCSDLKTFCVIKRWANNPRCKYHRSHCCFHAVISCAVLHPGTPCLHTQINPVLFPVVFLSGWKSHLFLQQKDLLSHFHWWKCRRHFYRSRSTPEGRWMACTPGAKTHKMTAGMKHSNKMEMERNWM